MGERSNTSSLPVTAEDERMRCDASATFLPTPPREVETIPGTVVYEEDVDDSESEGEGVGLEIMSTAEPPMIATLGGARGRGDNDVT